MLKVKELAVKAVEKLITEEGKPVTFIKVEANVNKYNPKETTRTTTEVTVQALYHPYGSKHDNTVLALPGVIESDDVIVTVLLKDFLDHQLDTANFFRIEDTLYKIKSFRKAVGFMSPPDRVYFFGSKAREQV